MNKEESEGRKRPQAFLSAGLLSPQLLNYPTQLTGLPQVVVGN